jgi:class 3 adenylate cyclase/HAMP domain-containing protein
MNIRLKIILIVIPLLFATLVLTGFSSYFSSTNAITRIAKDFLGFKARELQNQAESQWKLLVDNNLSTNTEMVAATKAAVEGYAGSILTSPSEVIVAFDADGNIAMSTSDVKTLAGEQADIRRLVTSRSSTLVPSFRLAGRERVEKGFWFAPFSWYIAVTEERAAFYTPVNTMSLRTAIILLASIGLGVALILLFANWLTRPLIRVVATMKNIISTNDLSERVLVEYPDEIGSLAQTFNLMITELEKAHGQIRKFAFGAVMAKKKEQKIKNIFEKYVPSDVIDTIVRNPESMLVGDSRLLVVLFSDIRGFTTISEGMTPDDLVTTLNRYFTVMVDIIMARGGIVDKYIGDAIMAFWGAPVSGDDDALKAVMAGIEMGEALAGFNEQLVREGRKPFLTGIGINRGAVTVGNIGAEKKLNYTVIGDPVNLASRLEGLTKQYHQSLIFSESLQMKVKEDLPCRFIDRVAVKGKDYGVKIFTGKRALQAAEREAWELHNAAMTEYDYEKRNFEKAAEMFRGVGDMLPGDYPSDLLMKRCQKYMKNPPPASWKGVEVMLTK